MREYFERCSAWLKTFGLLNRSCTSSFIQIFWLSLLSKFCSSVWRFWFTTLFVSVIYNTPHSIMVYLKLWKWKSAKYFSQRITVPESYKSHIFACQNDTHQSMHQCEEVKSNMHQNGLPITNAVKQITLEPSVIDYK